MPIIDIKNYTPTLHDIFFLDNNIWMYLFCPIGNYERYKQSIYSSFFQSAVSNKSMIYINSLVLSEFSNAFLRLDFKLWIKENKMVGEMNYKKDYIPTKRYITTAKSVTTALSNILKITTRMSDNFNAVNLDRILDNLSLIDFNDCYYEEYCNISNIKLVTDDKDFNKIKNSNINILTI